MHFRKIILKGILTIGSIVSSFCFPIVSNASGLEEMQAPPQCTTGGYRSVASSILSPTAFGLGWGQAGIGLGYVNHWIGADDNDNDSDGFGVIAFGIGDPKKLALTTAVLIDSLGGNDDAVAENGTVGFKLSHTFADRRSAIAAGVANGIPWGAFNDDAHSYYGVGTHIFNLTGNPYKPLFLAASVGIGTGAFASADDFRDNEETVTGFGSLHYKYCRLLQS